MGKNKIMDFFSDLGRSLLMPIAALAACGIVLGLSSALMKAQVVETVTILQQPLIHFVIYTLNKVANVVFTLIPVLFAISISFGLAKEEKEIAAFAGFIGYYTFPVAISFYGGKRFVALIVMLAMAVVGLIAPFVWEPISVAINGMGGLISATGLAGVFCYGFLERLLIPTGLHHVLNGIFRTTAIGGVYEGVEGCLNIFLQFIDKVDIKELAPFTVFLGQGKMPMMMFGLPGAAYAIYKTAPEEKKPKVKALMIGYLTRKNLSIDVSDEEEEEAGEVSLDEKQHMQAARIIEGLGGHENIGQFSEADGCFIITGGTDQNQQAFRADILQNMAAHLRGFNQIYILSSNRDEQFFKIIA